MIYDLQYCGVNASFSSMFNEKPFIIEMAKQKVLPDLICTGCNTEPLTFKKGENGSVEDDPREIFSELHSINRLSNQTHTVCATKRVPYVLTLLAQCRGQFFLFFCFHVIIDTKVS